ncbi:MAG: phosphoenolpyruvate--protein phosphotransferase [Simkaniaceae bacterium]
MVQTDREIVIKGVPVSTGMTIGTLFFIPPNSYELPIFSLNSSQVENEIQRFRSAIDQTRKDLLSLKNYLISEGHRDAATIIQSHLQLLSDPFLTTFVEEQVLEKLQNVESIYDAVISNYEGIFSKVKDHFFRERFLDVKDLSYRVLRHLLPKASHPFSKLPKNAVIFAQELVPSDTAEASHHSVAGFVTLMGGQTSHAALIARAKGIPYISSVDVTRFKEFHLAQVLLDATAGEIVICPSQKRCQTYRSTLSNTLQAKAPISFSPLKTLDHIEVDLLANIESESDLPLVKNSGTKGVGLFRTEFLFPFHEIYRISQDDQERVYTQIVQSLDGIPVVFRLFDIGGDKGFGFINKEPNPALGCRGIRFLLNHPDIFSRQVRALLIASEFGPIKLLIPMVTHFDELLRAKSFILSEAKKMKLEASVPEIGAMIEVPSAALMSDRLAKESAFFSIGTNDLIQYTLATDRLNPKFYEEASETLISVLRLIEIIVKNAPNIPISVCGELASDLKYTEILLGLGIRQFSCAPPFIMRIREKILTLSFEKAEALSKERLKREV